MIPKRRLRNKGMEFFTRMERISPLSIVGGDEVVSVHCILLSEYSFLSFGEWLFGHVWLDLATVDIIFLVEHSNLGH
jgi:hypothetical protein